MGQPMPHRPPLNRGFVVFLLGFFAVWSVWCVVLYRAPETFMDGRIRGLARLLLWIVPTLIYVAWSEKGAVITYLRLWPHAGKGVLWGLAAAILHPVAEAVYRLYRGSATLVLPGEADWLNPILGAPLAEELLFRGVVLQRLAEALGRPWAVVASAVLFSLIHLPAWWLSGDRAAWDLLAAEGMMVVYGVVFAVVFLASGSLWAPLIYHWANNLLNTAVK
jgi:membrane protease YdiL (CAAX protease family)